MSTARNHATVVASGVEVLYVRLDGSVGHHGPTSIGGVDTLRAHDLPVAVHKCSVVRV